MKHTIRTKIVYNSERIEYHSIIKLYEMVHMDKKDAFKDKKKEEEIMAVLAKPINKIPIVKKKDSPEFIRTFNENKISKDFLDSCRKAGKLFGKHK